LKCTDKTTDLIGHLIIKTRVSIGLPITGNSRLVEIFQITPKKSCFMFTRKTKPLQQKQMKLQNFIHSLSSHRFSLVGRVV